MDEEMMDIEDLRDKRIKEGYIELGKLKIDDPNRTKISNEIKVLEEVKANERSNETIRLKNNAEIENNERKVSVEERKVRNDLKRIRLDGLKFLGYLGLGSIGTIVGYNLDKTENMYKKAEMFVKDLRDKLDKR